MPHGISLLVPSDEKLLEQSAQGDREALAELFRRYRQIAYGVAHRLLGNEADALDAVQEAFVKALLHLANFQGPSTCTSTKARRLSSGPSLIRNSTESGGRVTVLRGPVAEHRATEYRDPATARFTNRREVP